MKYNELTFGQMEAIVNKLGGMEGVQRFLSGEIVVKAPEQNFKVWKTIKLGTIKNADEFRKALKKAGFKISDWANDIILNMNRLIKKAMFFIIKLLDIKLQLFS